MISLFVLFYIINMLLNKLFFITFIMLLNIINVFHKNIQKFFIKKYKKVFHKKKFFIKKIIYKSFL